MNKSELVAAIAEGTGSTKVEANRFLEVFTMTMVEAVKRGDQVVVPGLLSCAVVNRAGKMGHNPRTGEKIQIPPSRQPKFKAGKLLKDAVKNV